MHHRLAGRTLESVSRDSHHVVQNLGNDMFLARRVLGFVPAITSFPEMTVGGNGRGNLVGLSIGSCGRPSLRLCHARPLIR
jgi:hypothetical protein